MERSIITGRLKVYNLTKDDILGTAVEVVKDRKLFMADNINVHNGSLKNEKVGQEVVKVQEVVSKKGVVGIGISDIVKTDV